MNIKTIKLFYAFLALLNALFLLVCPAAIAAPDGGVLQQQIDRDRNINLPTQNSPIDNEPNLSGSAKGQTVTVNAFVFNGNTLLSSDQLKAAVVQYIGRPLTFGELQQAVQAVTKFYRESGWIVRAYLPEQDVLAGSITIQIVEATFGGVNLEGSSNRVSVERIMRMVQRSQNKGQLLNSDKLDRSVLLIDDLPGFGVLGSLKKGGAQSQTDLVLKLKDGPRINGNVNMDNSGSRATGSARINGNFYLNSPLGFGDLAVINMIHSEGTDYARAGYSIPVGDDGMRVGVNGSYSSYDLVADEYKTLDARGKFFTAGLEASYPIVRARTRNLYIDLNADHRNFDNQVGITTTSKYSVNNIGVGLSGNLFDRFGGSNVFGVKLARGNVILGELNSSENSSLGGSFLKLNYNLSRQQSINESLSFFAGLNGQISNTNLDSSEKIYLGGINGVRAYPANEAGGTDGQILNLEVRKRLPNNFGVTGFYDLGHVQVGLNNGSGPDNITLKGVGASLSWQANFGLALRATWSRRLGDNPNPTSTGSDQDGSLHKHRFWLTASMPF